MNRFIIGAAVLLLLTGCASKKEVVQVGDVSYGFKEAGTAEDRTEEGDKRDKIVDPTFTPPQYVLMFQQAGEVDQKTKVDGGGANIHHARAAVIGGSMVISPTTGLFGAVSVLDLGATLLQASQEKAYIKLSVMGNYEAATDGTITIARWMPGSKPHEALGRGYAEIKDVLADRCGFVAKPSQFFKFADRKAEIRGKCEAKGAYMGMYSDASVRFPQLQEAMGDGSLVTFFFPARLWNEQERKDLARHLRERLPAGWYVMRAMPIEDKQTGKMEPQYLVSMGGQHRAFPLPPKPVFK